MTLFLAAAPPHGKSGCWKAPKRGQTCVAQHGSMCLFEPACAAKPACVAKPCPAGLFTLDASFWSASPRVFACCQFSCGMQYQCTGPCQDPEAEGGSWCSGLLFALACLYRCNAYSHQSLAEICKTKWLPIALIPCAKVTLQDLLCT